MKNMHKYCCLLLLLAFAHINSSAEDYSKMSADQLNEALIIAVKKGSSDEVQKLAQAGADGNQKITYTKHNYDDYDSVITCTLLEYAAKCGYVDIVKGLIVKAEHDDINKALVIAAQEGHASVVRELIQAGDSKLDGLSSLRCLFVNSEKCKLCTNKKYRDAALIGAAQNFPGITTNPSTGGRYRTALKDYLNVIKELIKAGAHVNHADKYGNTALIEVSKCSLYTEAQEKDRAEIIQDLLEAKANVNQADKSRDGDTALIYAIKKHNIDAVQILLKAPGINVNYANNNGDTALIIALKYIQTTYISGRDDQYNDCLNSQKILEILLKTPGINPHHVNKNGDTAVKLLNELQKKMNYY